MMSVNDRPIAVLGAGPMGLMAAIVLAEGGQSVDLYERDDRIGGMSAHFDFDGLRIERYYHFVCKTDDPLFILLEELGIADRLRWTDTKMGYFYNGRQFPWGTPAALLRFPHLDLLSKLRYAVHVMRTKSVRDWNALDRVNCTQWIRRWIGSRAYDVLWKRAFELKFYEYTENLSAAWIGTRIKRIALSRRSLLQESLGYLEGGSEVVLAAMAARLLKAGGRIHLSRAIERVEVVDNRVAALHVGGERRACHTVVSTAPIQYVPRIVPDLPADFAAQICAVENIAVACVILKLRHAVTENFWLNISDPEIEIPGLIEYSNLNSTSAAHIVYAPFYMPTTHPKWLQTNADFINEALACVKKVNTDFSADWVMATHCHRYEYAQTICPPGFRSMLPPMRTPVDGLFMADTAYYYPEDRSISESVAVGRRLAHVVLGDSARGEKCRDSKD